MRAAVEVASESEVENTEVDPENATEVKGEKRRWSLLDGGATCILRPAVGGGICRRKRCSGRDGHGEGDPKKGQQSNGNHQHSSSGDCLWGNLSKEGSW